VIHIFDLAIYLIHINKLINGERGAQFKNGGVRGSQSKVPAREFPDELRDHVSDPGGPYFYSESE
jgi:hypothetical protein